MKTFSTNQAARKLGITSMTLSRYIRTGKVPKPKSATSGGMTIHFWTGAEIEHLRQLLPKIVNGRKTRYQKQKGKTQKPQPKPAHGAPGSSAVPHKERKKKK
jgi:predicted site-specific integrase-resolvase